MKLVRVMTCVASALIGLAAVMILFGNSGVWAQQPPGERHPTDRVGRSAQYEPAAPTTVITSSNPLYLAGAIGINEAYYAGGSTNGSDPNGMGVDSTPPSRGYSGLPRTCEVSQTAGHLSITRCAAKRYAGVLWQLPKGLR